MDSRIQILAIAVTIGLLIVVFELVRRRRLMERYALLWLISAVVLLNLAIWRGLLEDLSTTLGIVYPPNALFVVAFGFVLALLLHFSLAISRLSDETKVLAQEIARLDQELRLGAPAAPGAGSALSAAVAEKTDAFVEEGLRPRALEAVDSPGERTARE
jgi:hypothetical protein